MNLQSAFADQTCVPCVSPDSMSWFAARTTDIYRVKSLTITLSNYQGRITDWDNREFVIIREIYEAKN